MHLIAIGEIIFLDKTILSSKRSQLTGGCVVHVTDKFYKILRDTPYFIVNKELDSNAYLFGKLFDISTYELIGVHMNDVANTSIVEITKITDKEVKEIMKKIEDFYKDKKKSYRWDWRPCLTKLRKELNDRVIFMGDTIPGDYGARILAHYNKKKEIDSLIIDADCFYDHSSNPKLKKLQISKLLKLDNKIYKGAYEVTHLDK